MQKVFKEMDRPIRVAVSYISQPQVLSQPSLAAQKKMIVKALEYQTAQLRDTSIEASTSGTLPVPPQHHELNSTQKTTEDVQDQEIVIEGLFPSNSSKLLENLQEMYHKSQTDDQVMHE